MKETDRPPPNLGLRRRLKNSSRGVRLNETAEVIIDEISSFNNNPNANGRGENVVADQSYVSVRLDDRGPINSLVGAMRPSQGSQTHNLAVETIDKHFRYLAFALICFWATLVMIVYKVVPSENLHHLEGAERSSAIMAMLLIAVSSITRIIPFLGKSDHQKFSGVFIGTLAVQFVAVTTDMLMAFFPTPVLLDPVLGTRVHVLRWCGWCPIAAFMTFMIEGSDMHWGQDGPPKDFLKEKYLHAAAQGGSVLLGVIFPFCPNKLTWYISMILSCCLYLAYFPRMASRTRAISLEMKEGASVEELERHNAAKLSLRLRRVCATVWSLMVVSYFTSSLIGPKFASEGSILCNPAFNMMADCFMDVVSKVLFTAIILDVHSEIFDPYKRAKRRLDELRRLMAGVWVSSSDVIAISSRTGNRGNGVSVMLSPSACNLGSQNCFSGRLSNEDQVNGVDMRSVIYELTEDALETAKVSSGKKSDDGGNEQSEPRVQPGMIFNVDRIGLSLSEPKARVSIDEEGLNIDTGVIRTLSDVVARAWASKDEREYTFGHNLNWTSPSTGETQFIRSEAKVSFLDDNALIVIVRDISERFRAFEAEKQILSETTSRHQSYSRLIDTANAPIFGVDTFGKVTIWNKNAHKLVGYSSQEVMGQNLVEQFITPEHRARVQSVIDQALAGEETANFEFPLMTKAGVRLVVLLNATPRRDEQGSVIGVAGIGQDITGRLAQEREYRRLIDTANAPIFGVDTQGRVNVWNKCADKLIGYTEEEVMGRSLVQEFITDDFKGAVQAVLDQALNGHETDNFEFPLITKGGARLEVLLNATTRRDEQGNIIGVVGIGQDITARLVQEREYARLIDTANAPIFGVDTYGAVNVWNKNAQKLVGYAPEEVMGKNLVQEFITDEFKTAVQTVLDQALQGEETANFEFPLMTKGGIRIVVLLNATTRRNEQGNIIGVVGIGQDITGRLAQEREYTRLIDTANAPIFGVDTLGRVNVWNKCAMRLIGYGSEEVMGRSLVQDFITDDFSKQVQTVLDQALAGDETDNFEFPLITKGGARIEVLLNATTRRDEQGNVIGVVGIGQDITARLAQEREYSKLIDSANAPIFGVDTQGAVNVWNQCAVRLVGYTIEEVMGKNLVQEFITKEYRAAVSAVLDKALLGNETANFEFPLITKNGVRIEVLLNATTRRDEQGNVIGVVGIGQDITARLAQEREYSKLIDSANAPIFGVDTEGRVNVWNVCACKLVGYSTDEVMGHSLVQEFITDDYQASVQAVLDKALDGVETANFEFPLITKAGARIEVLLNATTRRNEHGRIIGVVGIGQDITGRIAQEREYSKLIDTANAPIFGVDTFGKVTIWNKNAHKLVGYSSQEVMGQNLVEQFITPEHRARVQSVIDQALAGEGTANFEFPLMTKAGVRLEVLLNATTRRDEQGSVIGVVGIGQDITGRLAQEREYRRLIDTANAPIFGVDTQGRVNVWNKCAMRLTGYPSEEVMGRSLVKGFIRKEHQEKVQAVIDHSLHGKETANFDFPLVTKGGVRLEILLNATARRNEHGNIIGMVGIGQDITERVAQEREFSKLIDSANAPIFGVDQEGRVNVWNQCVSSLTGFSTAYVLGRKLVDEFVSSGFKDSVSDILKNALLGIETSNFEFPLLTSGDHVVEVLLNATTRRDAKDKIIGVVGIGQDITDARAKRDAEMKQREAEAATAAQATISAHVYHEIRNVVGSVLALADRATEAVDLALIEEDDGVGLRELPTRVRELTDHQRLVCQHAVDTLNDMLDVAKMENGTYTLKREVIDLGELCRRAAALQSPRMRSRVSLELNIPAPETFYVISDSVLLLQYLSNLLSNAAKFTAEGGVSLVCIAREAGPDWVEVTLGVADSGKGISRDAQQVVLRAFTTGDALPQEDTIGGMKGTGIGLHLADLIVHTITEPLKTLQDGTISKNVKISEAGTLSEDSIDLHEVSVDGLRIESPLDKTHNHFVPNGGLGTFIYFQSAIQRASEIQICRHQENPSGVLLDVDCPEGLDVEFSGTLKALVIDDQKTMRQMVAMIYQKIAIAFPGVIIHCYTALSGEQAIRMCREHRFHIITMDQQMSIDYCQGLIDEMLDGQRPDGKIPEFVRFGSDKLANTKFRQAYFKNDKWIHDIQPGDGTLLGHEAIRKIRVEVQEENRPPVLTFNLTGNLLEADQRMFLEVGSSGMLPKPTKFEDFMNLIKKNMGLWISQGLLQLSEDRVVMDEGNFQIGTRSLRDEADAEEPGASRLTVPWAGGATQRARGMSFARAEDARSNRDEPGAHC